jgi:hypothetical protein
MILTDCFMAGAPFRAAIGRRITPPPRTINHEIKASVVDTTLVLPGWVR